MSLVAEIDTGEERINEQKLGWEIRIGKLGKN